MRSAVTLLVGAALYALAQPPFDWAVLGWLALVPLLFAVRGRSARWALGYGALYGCACSWTVAGWLAQTISRFFGLGLLLGVAAAEGYALLFWGTAFALFAGGAAILLRPQRCPTARFAIPALWVATELLRGRILGQPWGLLGYSQHAHPALIQVAAVTAVYGVSFLVALVSTAVVEATTAFERGLTRAASPPRLRCPPWRSPWSGAPAAGPFGTLR